MALLGNGYQPSPYQGILGQPAGVYNQPPQFFQGPRGMTRTPPPQPGGGLMSGLKNFDANALISNPLLHAGVALLGSRGPGSAAPAALQGLMQGAQVKSQLAEQQREQDERERQQAALSQLGETMPQLKPFLGTGLEGQAMTMLGKSQGGGIGTYNPRDYTTESWTEFVQGGAKDPSVLNRYAGTLEERMASDPEFAARVMEFQKKSAGGAAGAAEEAKLFARLQMQPQVDAAVARAKAEAEQGVKRAGEQRGNDVAYQTYTSAMNHLASAMGETVTGPGVGYLPAITTNAQIAEGAVSVMAPILKSMFRTAGEGTFTDRDQELLMNMLPTRNDTAEARAAKIQAIDAVVQMKLGQGRAAPGGATPQVNAKGWRLMRDAQGNRAYVGPNGEIEEVR